MTRFNLTEGEKQVLRAQLYFANLNCGATTVEVLIDDNCSWADVSDLASYTGFNMAQIKGFVGSLVKKGILGTEKINGHMNMIHINDWFLHQLDKELELKAIV